MGKILIIQGADFSKYKVENIKLPVKVEEPILTLDGNYLNFAISLKVSSPFLDIKYTLDGSEPNTDSILYTSPIDIVGGNKTVRAISVNSDNEMSKIHKITITYDVKSDTISVSSLEDGILYYTDDESVPNTNSMQYTSSIQAVSGNTYKFALYNGTTLKSEISKIIIQ